MTNTNLAAKVSVPLKWENTNGKGDAAEAKPTPLIDWDPSKSPTI
jgi:hypothetical protein